MRLMALLAMALPMAAEIRYTIQVPADAALGDAVTAVLRAPEHRELLGAEGGIVVAGTPEAFTAVIRAETAKWLRVAKDAGLKPE